MFSFQPTKSTTTTAQSAQTMQSCIQQLEKLSKSVADRSKETTSTSQRAQDILANARDFELKRMELRDRLMRVSEGMAAQKIEVGDMKKAYKSLTGRANKMLDNIAFLSTQIRNSESYAEEFANYEECVEILRTELHDVNMKSAAALKAGDGSAVPFYASAKAQKFMLSKLDNDVAKLVDAITYINQQLKSIQNLYNVKLSDDEDQENAKPI